MKPTLQSNDIDVLYKNGGLAFGTNTKEAIFSCRDLNSALSLCNEASRAVTNLYMNHDQVSFKGPDDYVPDPYSIEEAVYTILDNFDVMNNLENLANKENKKLFSDLKNPRQVFSLFIRYAHKFYDSNINILQNKLVKADRISNKE